jgi:mono/diheme cytochrome c family protein
MPEKFPTFLLALTAPLLACALARSADQEVTPESDRFYRTHVEPVLRKSCFGCHGAIKKKSSLDLRTMESILRGGEHGPAIVPGKPTKSAVFRLIQPGADPQMPPGKKRLSAEEISVIAAWIRRLDGDARTPRAKTGAGPSELAESRPSWLPPRGVDPRSVIDLLVEAGWAQRHVRPSARASDATFVRRLHLDLVGRVPTEQEATAFLADTASDKRDRLIDRLLESPEHARHLCEIFDVVLMGRESGKRAERRSNGWTDYLERAFRENRPWSQVVRDVIQARPDDDKDLGAVWFLYERRNQHQQIAAELAPALLGIQIQCAQCHDHPIAPEILQSHYWGLTAFFSRSTNVRTKRGIGIAESAIGGHSNYSDLAGKSHPALLAFFDGTVVPETRPKKDEKESDSPDKYLVSPSPKGESADRAALPKLSRRRRLAEIVIDKSPLPARAFVNRAFALLLGRGLVHPVDKMDSTHPPSHPELLDWLTRDFVDSGYDVRRLLRAIVRSRPYQLSSTPAADAKDGRRPLDESFACAMEKPLAAEALYRSLLVVTGNTAQDEAPSALIDQFPTVFHEDFDATLKQALFLTNNPLVAKLVEPRAGNTTMRLLEIPENPTRVKAAFRIVLQRDPGPEELTRSVEFLDAREDRPTDGVEQLLWALLTSPEFRFNH